MDRIGGKIFRLIYKSLGTLLNMVNIWHKLIHNNQPYDTIFQKHKITSSTKITCKRKADEPLVKFNQNVIAERWKLTHLLVQS